MTVQLTGAQREDGTQGPPDPRLCPELRAEFTQRQERHFLAVL